MEIRESGDEPGREVPATPLPQGAGEEEEQLREPLPRIRAARLDEPGNSSLARNQYHQQDRDAATEATSKNVQNRNDHARIYSPRKRQRAVQTRTGASQRRTALLKYLGWGDRDTLHTTVASSRAGVRCGTQLVRTGHPACSILHWGRNFPTKS